MGLRSWLRREEPVDGQRWLVVGLGNPGPEYEGSRHNVGADTVRFLADRLQATLKAHKAKAQVADTFAPDRTPVSLVLPFGYYNTSGGPVRAAMDFYKVSQERLVVIHDDLDLEPGAIRLKRGGGTAGNKGLADIQQRTGGTDFARVRLGIGRPPGNQDAASYVLKRFSKQERAEADAMIERAADAVLDLITDGLERAQNRHHVRE